MGFVQKIEISLCILLVGYILDWVGFNGSLTTQPAEVLNRLYWLSVIPNIIFTSLCFILALRFPLTEAMMTEVRKQLDKRHQAAAAAATSSAASEPDGRPLSTA
jgi:Na+/melibiose symporter-like transporter